MTSIKCKYQVASLLVISIISMFLASQECRALPAVRPQHQVFGDELASGLTGTGISFNSWNNRDPYNYQQQSQQSYLNDPYDDIAPPVNKANVQQIDYKQQTRPSWSGFGQSKIGSHPNHGTKGAHQTKQSAYG